MSGIINPSFDGSTYNMCGNFHFPFPSQQVLLQKISFSVLLNFGNSSLYTFWKLKEAELVKNDFQKAQIVTHYSY